MNIFFADDGIVRIILTLTAAAWSYNPSQTLSHRGRGNDTEDEGRGEGGKRGTEAPPDPPILADAKGGQRTEGRERADDSIVLKKKKEARHGDRAKE